MLVRQEAGSAVDLVACLDLEVEVLVVTFSCFLLERDYEGNPQLLVLKWKKRGMLYGF